MTYPGLVLLVGVGIGLATFLYYVFTESRVEERQQYSRNGPSSDDEWTGRSHRSENAFLSRRYSSNSPRETSGVEDVNNCSICQYALIELDVLQLQPCRHIFHKECYSKLKKFDPRAPCPNCRRQINQAM